MLEQHHATHQQRQELIRHLPVHRPAAQSHQMIYQHQAAHGNKHHREERESAQTGNRRMMHLSLVRHVKQSLLMRDEQNVRQHDIGDDHRHDKGTQQIKMNWLNHISILLFFSIYFLIFHLFYIDSVIPAGRC